MHRRLSLPLLTLILLSAAFLRFHNLSHGIGAHPDERGLIMMIHKLSWENLNPNSFHYGSFAFYLLWFSSQALSVFSPDYASYDGLFLVGRSIAVFAGTLSVGLLYLLTKLIYRREETAILAAALLAFNALHIQLSRFFTVDILLTTTSLAALYCILQVSRSNYAKWYIAAGILIGISFATKISGITLFLPLGVAGLLHHFHRRRFFIPRSAGLAILSLAAAMLTVFLVEPFFYFSFDKFQLDNMAQIRMVQGKWRPPFTIQYAGTLAYWYPLRQILSYSMGWPLGLSVVLGVLFTIVKQLRRPRDEEIILLSWVLFIFFSVAGLYVKFPRYLLLIYPILFLFAAALYASAANFLKKREYRYLPWVPAIFLGTWTLLSALWASSIYRQDHVWKTASIWIYKNLPAESLLLHSHWDDRLPISLPKPNSRPSRYKYSNLPVFEADTEEKLDKISTLLSQGDYLVMPTRRLYGGIPRIPEEFPDTTNFIRLLFAEKLGYFRQKTFKVRPSLGPLVFNDDLADESLVVYDHPKVTIFHNTKKLNPEEIASLIRNPQRYPLVPSVEEIMTHGNSR